MIDVQKLIDGIHTYIARAVRPLDERLKLIESRLAAVEASPLFYDGPHESGKAYSRGTFVTHDGSLWHANQSTSARPGDGGAWTLAVKRGKDGAR